MPDLIKPEIFEIEGPDGKTLTYYISNFDAVRGREIISQYPMTAVPKFGEYEQNEKLLFKLMGYVAIKQPNGEFLRLETEALVNNHVPDWETLAKIEMAMMNKNCSFFRNGRSWDFLENIAQIFLKKASEMLTRSSEQSLQAERPPSTN